MYISNILYRNIFTIGLLSFWIFGLKLWQKFHEFGSNRFDEHWQHNRQCLLFGFSDRMKKYISPPHNLSYPELLLFTRTSLALLLYLEKRRVMMRRRRRPQMTRPTKGRSCKLKGNPEPKSLVDVVREHSSDQLSGTRLPVSCLNFSRGHRTSQPGKVRGKGATWW